MPIHISLLRSINVGGNRKIPMAELRALYQSLGFTNISTYVQSGNVIFESDSADASVLAPRIEAAISEHFGFEVSVLLRTVDDLRQILDCAPFPSTEPTKLHVLFLSEQPDENDVAALNVPTMPGEAWAVAGREIYLYYPNGSGRSKMTGTFFERKLAVTASARNWNSLNALYKLARS